MDTKVRSQKEKQSKVKWLFHFPPSSVKQDQNKPLNQKSPMKTKQIPKPQPKPHQTERKKTPNQLNTPQLVTT